MADVVYLVNDLFFVAKIEETAAQLGVVVERARDPEALAAVAPAARVALVDLRRPDALDALDRLRAAAPDVRSVGFIDHENVEAMEAASAHGCRTVVSKRKFASSLPELLAG
jgi:DNA-binding NarL/FixJ family response regulator